MQRYPLPCKRWSGERWSPLSKLTPSIPQQGFVPAGRKPRLFVAITLAETGGAQSYLAHLLPALVQHFDVTVAAHGPRPATRRSLARRNGVHLADPRPSRIEPVPRCPRYRRAGQVAAKRTPRCASPEQLEGRHPRSRRGLRRACSGSRLHGSRVGLQGVFRLESPGIYLGASPHPLAHDERHLCVKRRTKRRNRGEDVHRRVDRRDRERSAAWDRSPSATHLVLP